MPSLGDSVFIFMLALMLLGPKKLPQLARQLGKLMAEFRKASNDFRMQMEDELRIEDQKEHQKKVDALAPPPSTVRDPTIPTEDAPHPHLPATISPDIVLPIGAAAPPENTAAAPLAESPVEPPSVQPIAESGDLRMMPPSTGLPVESSARRTSFAATDASPDAVANSGFTTVAGISSDEPAETVPPPAPYEPPPDRGHPVMAGEGERATHV